MNKSAVINTLISSIGGALIGGGITYLTVKKVFKERSDAEIAEVKKYYALVRKEANVVSIYGELPGNDFEEGLIEGLKGPKGDPGPHSDEAPHLAPEEMDEVRKYVEALGYSGDDLTKVAARKADEVKHASKTETIFDHAVEDPGPELDGPNGKPIEPENLSDEKAASEGLYSFLPGEPHIISVDDFFNTEEDWDKTSLSYYRADDTLIDERMTIVDYRDRYIGDRHLRMFGIKSGDKNVVYVRSPQISTDFEIILEQGKASSILGDPEDEEENFEPRRAPRRMRDSD